VGLFGLYLPLTILCAKADHDRWKPYKGEGECWSEGSGAYANLGIAAGALMGFGVGGLIILLAWLKHHARAEAQTAGLTKVEPVELQQGLV